MQTYYPAEARASANDRPRPPYGRGNAQRRRARKHEMLTIYLRGGGSLGDFARIHRISVAAAQRLAATRDGLA